MPLSCPFLAYTLVGTVQASVVSWRASSRPCLSAFPTKGVFASVPGMYHLCPFHGRRSCLPASPSPRLYDKLRSSAARPVFHACHRRRCMLRWALQANLREAMAAQRSKVFERLAQYVAELGRL